MKKVVLFAVAALFIFGFVGNVSAYEGGTKFVATMTHPEQERMASGPLILAPYSDLSPGKLIERYLHQLPEPTLSAQGIREETPGPSLGTKGIIRFQKTGRA